MKIGILSDMHTSAETLKAALKIFEREGIGIVICCGDAVDAGLVALFAGLELHLVEGNIDHELASLRRAVERLGNGSTFGLEYTAALDGKHVAALHGHLTDRLTDVIVSGLYDYVFHGHTHHRRDQRIGSTRVINPGALGGLRHETRSVAVLDIAADRLRFVEIGS